MTQNLYLLFAGDDYYPRGGAFDLKGGFATLEEAIAAHDPSEFNYDGGWANVLSAESMTIPKFFRRGTWYGSEAEYSDYENAEALQDEGVDGESGGEEHQPEGQKDGPEMGRVAGGAAPVLESPQPLGQAIRIRQGRGPHLKSRIKPRFPHQNPSA